MPKLLEVLQLPGFQEFTPVTSYDGLTEDVSNITILEYEWFSQNFEVFHPHDLILTSLFFAREDPSLIAKSFARLIERHVAAIAVKTVFFTELPPEAVALAERHHVPLFFFHDAYMEDLIITFHQLLDSQQRYLHFEEIVYHLLHENPDARAVEKAARELNPAFLPYLTAFYATLRDGKEELPRISQAFGQILAQHSHARHYFYTTFLKYQNGLMILCTSAKESAAAPEQVCHDLLAAYGIDRAQYAIGSSGVHATFSELPLAVQESLDSNQIARMEGQDFLRYDEIHIYRYLLPLCRLAPIRQQASRVFACLRDYDQRYHSSLLETLTEYIRQKGKVSATAAALYQHPNTIRYRLQKAQGLLAPYLGAKNFQEQLYMLMEIEKLQQYNRE